VQPAAREVEHVAAPHRDVEHGLPRLAHLGHVLLLLQRQLEDGWIDEPPLLALHLEAEDVVRVVVHRKALRARRRVVRVRLHGMTELSLEAATELGQRRVP
jgi:hypothetical protein